MLSLMQKKEEEDFLKKVLPPKEYEKEKKKQRRSIGYMRPSCSKVIRKYYHSSEDDKAAKLPKIVNWNERKELVKAQKLVMKKEIIAGHPERSEKVSQETEQYLFEHMLQRTTHDLMHILSTGASLDDAYLTKTDKYEKFVHEVENPKKFSHFNFYDPNPVKRFLIRRDISAGRETFPVPVYSDTKDSHFVKDFQYSTVNKLPAYGEFYAPWDWEQKEKFKICCDCTDGCLDADKCRCRAMNKQLGNTEILPDGRLILTSAHWQTIIVTCGPDCHCIGRCESSLYPYLPPTINKFEVFKRNDKVGYGARTMTNIKTGAVVTEFVGEIISKATLHRRNERDKEHENYSMLLIRDEERTLFEKLGILEAAEMSMQRADEQHTLYVDPYKFGGVSRYISHGCSPNLSMIRVAVNDLRTPFIRILMVANQPIVAGSELFFDYGANHFVGRGIECLCNTVLCGPERQYFNARLTSSAELLQHFRIRFEALCEQQKEMMQRGQFLLEHKRYITDIEALLWLKKKKKPLPQGDGEENIMESEEEEEDDRNVNNHPKQRYTMPNLTQNAGDELGKTGKRLPVGTREDPIDVELEAEEPSVKKRREEEDTWNKMVLLLDRCREIEVPSVYRLYREKSEEYRYRAAIERYIPDNNDWSPSPYEAELFNNVIIKKEILEEEDEVQNYTRWGHDVEKPPLPPPPMMVMPKILPQRQKSMTAPRKPATRTEETWRRRDRVVYPGPTREMPMYREPEVITLSSDDDDEDDVKREFYGTRKSDRQWEQYPRPPATQEWVFRPQSRADRREANRRSSFDRHRDVNMYYRPTREMLTSEERDASVSSDDEDVRRVQKRRESRKSDREWEQCPRPPATQELVFRPQPRTDRREASRRSSFDRHRDVNMYYRSTREMLTSEERDASVSSDDEDVRRVHYRRESRSSRKNSHRRW